MLPEAALVEFPEVPLVEPSEVPLGSRDLEIRAAPNKNPTIERTRRHQARTLLLGEPGDWSAAIGNTLLVEPRDCIKNIFTCLLRK